MLMFALTVSLSAQAQNSRRVKVYQQGGTVETLRMEPGSTISHSCYDMDGVLREDYVTMEVSNQDGIRRYPLSDVDSLVLPNGRTVVFHGYTYNGNGTTNYTNNTNFGNGNPQAEGDSSLFTPHSSIPKRTSFSGAFPGGDRVTYYWTENDHIRLETGQESRAKSLSGDKTCASFSFDDIDELAEQIVVYYPDKKVTIPTVQNQNSVNNTDHIGESGDCGVAVAELQDDDSYAFSLSHKASYLCFLPRIAHLPSVRVTSIDVTCSSNIAGTFQVSEGGLFNGENKSNSISLNLIPHPQRTNQDFFLANSTELAQETVASYMVIAPQSSNRDFTIVYHLTDTLSRYTTTYTQSVSFKPEANKVYPITCNIPESLFSGVDLGYDYVWANANLGSTLPNEPGDYYTWQATHEQMTGSWEMPTEDARSELQKCTWTWGTFNGTEGWFVEGTNNGNEEIGVPRIFIPLAGYKDGSTLHDADKGYYWMDSGLGNESATQNALIVSHDEKTSLALTADLALNTRPVHGVKRSFNIPSSGRNYVDLRGHGSGYSIKVYDHGGPNGDYGDRIDGYLQITCAEGYKLNVTGSVNTESNHDYINVYNVTENGEVLIGSRAGNNTSINATTNGNVMVLRFYTDGSQVFSGLDLTVTIQKTSVHYAVNISEVTGGTIVSDVSSAIPEDTITLTTTPAPGYVLHHITVEADGKVLTLYEDDPKLFKNPSSAKRHYLMCDTVRVRDGNWYHDVSHFLMPYSDVVVTPHFVNDDADLEVIMAGNDTTFIEQKYMQRLLDNGMSHFRFYDYGGKYGNYVDNYVDGYMLVHAPVHYKLNVAGNVWTEGDCDPLVVHDGYTTGNQALATVGGTTSFDVTTNNEVAFMHFHTDYGNNGYAGYAATVTMLEDTRTEYEIPAYTFMDLTEEHMAYFLANGMTYMNICDHAGPDANYGDAWDGKIRITLPKGYKFHVSGTSSTEPCCDYLQISDNNVVVATYYGENLTVDRDIESRVLTLRFHSDTSSNRAGVNLRIDFIPPTEGE